MKRLTVTVCLLLASRAHAFVLSEDPLEEKSTELGLMVRLFSFTMAGPILRPPYNPLGDANPTGMGLGDLRLSFEHKSPRLKLVLHNQLTTTARSHADVGLFSLGRGAEPRRWLPLDTDLVDEGGYTLRESLDWAYLSVTLGPLTVAAGRQPITLGRGKLWKPLDLISTFAITEVDTEYKPGADALRLDWTVREQTILTLLAAAGEWQDDLLTGSSFALRGKQGFTWGELGALAGMVRRDVVLGLDGAVDLGRFDVYGEAAVHLLTDESPSPGLDQRSRAVVRAVAGATFKPTAKLTLSPEVFYNGFGAWDAADYLGVATSDRVAMGEMYNMGRVYVAGIALWEAHPLLTASAALMLNPIDPSALISLGLTYSLAGNMSLVLGGYVPAGRVPNLRASPLPAPRSEFGLYPHFVYLELKAAL